MYVTNSLTPEERKAKMKKDILKKLHKQALDFVDDRPEQANSCSSLILVLYNFFLVLLWVIFAVIFFVEIKEFSWSQCVKNPQMLHRQSIKVLRYCQVMQMMNVVMAIAGITKTGIINEFLQQLVRCLFTFITINEFDATKGPWVTTALFAFALGETARYPYYFLKCLGLETTDTGLFFGHLRYNFFFVFYPLGSFCDGMTHIFAAEKMR